MTLDLAELTAGWDCPPGELRARLVIGRDGKEQIQLRVDLGVMQMFPTHRPDGQRYRGLPSAREYIQHELQVGGDNLTDQDWRELERELVQTNYRRMAFAILADEALQTRQEPEARRFIHHALSDIETCLESLKLQDHHRPDADPAGSLRTTLLFDQARLATQLSILDSRFEDAIEHAEAGARALEELLTQLGYEPEQLADDPAVNYLRQLGTHLRREYGIIRTRRELLAEAIENEDFETAARLRDELQRQVQPRPPRP